MSEPKLFQPIQVGDVTLAHRVVLAPLTRLRANREHVHGKLAVEYYTQRASIPGTLLISEATFITGQAGGFHHVPGIWSDAQIAAWKSIVDAVHAQGSFIYLQLWALGRCADVQALADEGYEYVAPAALGVPGKEVVPRALTLEEINGYIASYAKAAANAVHGAGFDGVEVHGANGYLIDQFIQDVSNNRVDEYGGSIENRCRFALEVINAISEVIGDEKIGLRLSPWGRTTGMRMEDPVPAFAYLATELVKQHPSMAYLHLVEPRVSGYTDREVLAGEASTQSNDFLRDIWRPRPFISAGGYYRELALENAEKKGDLIAFGRSYIGNLTNDPQPDLPLRLQKNIALTKGNRETYYTPESAVGYTDYPFAESQEDAPRPLL
ncbi:hypothetical protein PHLCEN_2v5627 [Hermanssonia centrifuga]|uniref:NADH:flavin oxidoreductase/NADH oxidase N-terminal domain-containing protein n=1 Tax=Hermanssonia centrifuga TaxID=98765 RepID=A0A2R6P1U0_9APHY|nr:hypothetical protein PHLCEN_2v5627 [Hermanssonia centrifuga]